MHGTTNGWNEFPCFLGREHKNGREKLAQTFHKPMKRSLRRAPAWRIRGVCVKTIFDRVVINRRQLNRDELAELLIYDMKFELVVSLEQLVLQFRKFAQNPPVEFGQLIIRDRMLCGIKVVKIGKLISQRVANYAIALRDGFDALVAHDDVVAKVLRC